MRLRLYERGQPQAVEKALAFNPLDWEAFQNYLWQHRLLSGRFLLPKLSSKIPFPYVAWEAGMWKPREFVGFLSYQGLEMEVFPRYFQSSPDLSSSFIFQHLAYVLGYGLRISGTASLGASGYSTPEPGTHFWQAFFEKSLLEQLENHPLWQYSPPLPRRTWAQGNPDMKRYSQESLPQGQWHRLYWQAISSQENTLFYQVLKAVIRKMLAEGPEAPSRERLGSILYFLENVPTYHPRLSDFEKLQAQEWPEPWQALLEYAQAYWQSRSIIPGGDAQAGMSWMLPMERLFEEFIPNFIRTHYPHWAFDYQKQFTLSQARNKSGSDLYIRPDLWFPDARLVVDTKYKYLSPDALRPEPSDVYQLLSYAQALGAKKALLLYPHPDTKNNPQNLDYTFSLASGIRFDLSLRFLDLRGQAPRFDSDKLDESIRAQLQAILGSELGEA